MAFQMTQFNWTEMLSEDVVIKVASTPKSSKLDLITNRLKVVIMSRKKYDVESRRKKVIDDMNQWYYERRHQIMYDHKKGLVIDTPSAYDDSNFDTSPGSLVVLHDYYRFGCHTDQKFFRVQIQKKIENSGYVHDMMLESYEGLLIDIGETARFCRHEIYPLESQFKPMPPQVFTIKLAGLEAFENTGRLGKVFESTLMHFGKEFIMRVKKIPTSTSPPEVDLIKVGLGYTLNDYIAMQCCTIPFDQIPEKTEGDKIEGCYVNTIFPGARIGVKLGLPMLKAILKCLDEAEAGGFERLKSQQSSDGSRKKDEKYVARHPETEKLERCKLLEDIGLEEEEAKVEWIDFGGQTSIKMSELVKAELVSPFLDVAPPTYTVFKLHNIIAIRIAPERLNTFVRSMTSPVTITITEIPLSGPPKVLVHYEGSDGQQEIFNKILIDKQVATAIDGTLDWTIPDPRILLGQLIWSMPMDLVSAEWTPLSKDNPLKTLKVEAGQRIAVNVPFDDGQFVHSQKFRVRPVLTNSKFERIEREIREYCSDIPFIADERDFKQLGLRDGEFCIVELVKGEFRRARICGRQQYHGQGHQQQFMYEVLVLDYGTVSCGLATAIIQVRNPWPLLSNLGPQIALAEWKIANDFIASMDGTPEQRLKELSQKLQEKLGNGKNVVATVTKIRKDQYGRNVLELAFDFDSEIERGLMLNTFRVV